MLAVDLSKSHSGRWKRDLPVEQIEVLVDIVEPIMKEYGYTVER